MIQIVTGDRTGSDNLAQIVDPIRNTVMAAGPDTQVDRNFVAPENRVGVDVRRACIAHDIARIVHSGSRGGEKSGRNRQLPHRRYTIGIRDVILPDHRVKNAPTGNEPRIINRLGIAYAEICHLAIAPKEPVDSRADRAVTNHVTQIVDAIGFAVVKGVALT
jgi:hypothetical protein